MTMDRIPTTNSILHPRVICWFEFSIHHDCLMLGSNCYMSSLQGLSKCLTSVFLGSEAVVG